MRTINRNEISVINGGDSTYGATSTYIAISAVTGAVFNLITTAASANSVFNYQSISNSIFAGACNAIVCSTLFASYNVAAVFFANSNTNQTYN